LIGELIKEDLNNMLTLKMLKLLKNWAI